MVENNIIVNNSFHPHVWFKHSQDVFRRNIMWTDHYLPAGGMPATPWGKEMDYNLVHRPGVMTPVPATRLASSRRRDEHSIVADALFVDPAGWRFQRQGRLAGTEAWLCQLPYGPVWCAEAAIAGPRPNTALPLLKTLGGTSGQRPARPR